MPLGCEAGIVPNTTQRSSGVVQSEARRCPRPAGTVSRTHRSFFFPQWNELREEKNVSVQCCCCSLRAKTNTGCCFPSKNNNKKTLRAGRHESSVSYFHLIKFLESVMQRTWLRLNPGADALPASETEPEKALAVLGGAASNVLTLVSCC